ncbi:DUF5915 domain-containing protein [Sphingomonas sp. LR61]|uniref:DUF5915 domain-containing protein n=1 Tax=Sphingomonas sp. LR61 TaxID=3050234 RepID=UPI002FE3CE55
MTVGGVDLVEGEYTLDLTVADPSVAVAFLDEGGFVVLDTVTTPELEAEGLARDVVRAVQQARRDADLDVSDRIVLTLGVDEAADASVRTHQQLIAGRPWRRASRSCPSGQAPPPMSVTARR